MARGAISKWRDPTNSKLRAPSSYIMTATPSRIALKNDMQVRINDYVYISAPWAYGLGEPYMIARVMDILQNEDQYGHWGWHVRVNLFLRMRDLTHRSNNDSRLLVATMHSDTFPLATVRGKCRVKHRDLISNGSPQELAAWKRRDDHFYYHQLFDRYIHRFYEVIPTWKLKNAPANVLQVLRERYSFIVAETSIASELCDALRVCFVCHEWASTAESVRCDTCRNFFHMQCLTPPLSTKPAKGYSWNCAPCARQHDEVVEEHGVGGGGLDAPSSAADLHGPRSTQTTKRKRTRSHLFGDVLEPVNEVVLSNPMDRDGLRCFQGWPYRYFGEHTSAMDVFDSHDSIYPRAVTRIGPKFQANVLSCEEQQHHTVNASSPTKSPSRKSKTTLKKRNADGVDAMDVDAPERADASEDEIFERGSNETIHTICIPPPDHDWNKVEQYLACVVAPRSNAAKYSYPFMNRALSLLCASGFRYEDAAKQFTQSHDSDFGLFPLTQEEEEILEKTIVEVTGDMRNLKRALPKRTPAQIVQGVYSWKLRRLKERWQGREKVKITLRGAHMQTQEMQRESSPALSVLSLDDVPESKTPPKLVCSFCSISTSPFWYKSPLYTNGYGLCVYCGQYWRKYAAETATAFITEKKRQSAFEHGSDETGLGVAVPNRAHIAATQQNITQPAASAPPDAGRCVMCRRLDPKKLLCNCANCGIAGHQGCLGLENADLESEAWLCDLCQNDQDPMSSILPFCILCGETPTDRITHHSLRGRKVRVPETDGKGFTALDVYKPTECNNWVHLLCALWTPDVLFANTVTMQPVEGAGNLPAWRYDTRCSLCDQVRGACVKCAEPTCRSHFHVSCAYLAQPSCILAFEIFPVKTSRRDSVHTLSFKSESGHMCAQIWCKDHLGVARSKITYDYHEMDPKLKLTAMQAYAKTHKQVATGSNRNMALVESTHALLRRAKRLDVMQQACGGAGGYIRDGNFVSMHKERTDTKSLEDTTNVKSQWDAQDVVCTKCRSDWSPLWWPVPGTDHVYCTMCHSSVMG